MSAQQSFDTLNNPTVDVQFSAAGATKFADITQKMAQNAQTTGNDQLLAVVLDGTVVSAPRVQEQISGGQAAISGKFTVDEAKNLALLIQTGALPVDIAMITQSVIHASQSGQ